MQWGMQRAERAGRSADDIFMIQTSPILTSGPRIFWVGRLMQASRLAVNGKRQAHVRGRGAPSLWRCQVRSWDAGI